MAIYVGFSGGIPVPYIPLNPAKFLVTNIPSYNGSNLQRCLLISCLWCCRRWLSSLPCGLGWPTALMDGWAGSRLKIEEKIPTFGAAKIEDLIGMLFHMAGVQQKVFLKGSQ